MGMMCKWTEHAAVAGMVAFIQVLILWALHAIAQELENPFGADANDLNVREMNDDMRGKLLLLLNPENYSLPQLQPGAVIEYRELEASVHMDFSTVWEIVDVNDEIQDTSHLKLQRLRQRDIL